jgi:hypothetical protein
MVPIATSRLSLLATPQDLIEEAILRKEQQYWRDSLPPNILDCIQKRRQVLVL